MRAHAKALTVAAAFAVGLAVSVWLSGLAPERTAGDARRPESAFRYRRIICMSPAASELAFAIDSAGMAERIVGVSSFTVYPPEAAEKPKCGGFIDPNYELILSLRPDLIVSQGEAEDLRRFADENGIDMFVLALDDLESILNETSRYGSVLECEEGAAALRDALERELNEIRTRVAGRPPVRALIVVGREPGSLTGINAVGPGGFLNDLIELAGGTNVGAGLPQGYAVVSKEALIERAPQVIVELHGEGGDQAALEAEVAGAWRAMSVLPAVRDGRVHALAATYAMVPGPRVVELASYLADVFRGEGGA